MKRKILASFILLVLIFTNYVYAGDIIYPRQGGFMLREYATVFNDTTKQLYLPKKFNAKSVESNNVEIYYSGETTKKNIDYSDSNGNFIVRDGYGYYSLKLEPNSDSSHQITFKIKDAIKCGNETYNVKLVIGRINVNGGIKNETTQPELQVRVQSVSQENNQITVTDDGIYPHIYVIPTETGKVEVNVDYYIYKDENGQEKPVSINGTLGLTDIDLQQGIVVGGFESTGENTFIKERTTKYLNVDTSSTHTHFYSIRDKDLKAVDGDPNCDAYLKMEDFNHGSFVFTYDKEKAGSNLKFEKIYKNYHTITANAIDGIITPKSITNIEDGDTKTVTYEPNNDRQYLEYIKVDGKTVSITDSNTSNYKFTNINEDHAIEVKYGEKLRVTFDSNGGTEVPESKNPQYVKPNTKAEKPTNPTRTGYTFVEWLNKKDNKAFDVTNTVITENTDLVAKWKPNEYTITYQLDGGTNAPSNPPKYKVTDVVDFKDPTKDGYVFKGWYTDADFTTPIYGIPLGSTGNKTIYAKWEKKPDTPTPEQTATYKIEHYMQDATDKSKYIKMYSNVFTGIVDETVTAPEASYYGYTENKSHSGRVISGKIKSDNTLTLKRYYDLNEVPEPEEPEQTATYKIEHYMQDATNKNNYNKLYSNVFTGIVGETVTAPEASYYGYTENTKHNSRVISGKIKSDNTLTLKRYYDLNEIPEPEEPEQTIAPYTVEHWMQDPTNENNYTKQYFNVFTGKIGETVTAPSAGYFGYTENESKSERVISGTIRADGKLVLKRYYDVNKSSEPETDPEPTPQPSTAKYTIEYYKQTSNNNYELTKSNSMDGTINTTVTIPEATYEGYKENTSHANRAVSGLVREDGGLVLRRYYDKLEYKVTFDPQNDNNTTIPTQTVLYNEKAIKPTDPTKDGFTFMYWYYMDENNQAKVYDFDTPVSKNIDLIARWEENKNTTPSESKKEEVPAKQDTTTSEQKVLPKTGIIGTTLLSMLAIAIAGLIFAIRYRKLKDIK